MEIEDQHSIYVMAGGHTIDEVEEQVKAWVTTPSVQEALASVGAFDAYELSMATNYEGTFLGYGYIYCESTALYHILLGRQSSGFPGVLVDGGEPVPYVQETPRWDIPTSRFNWADATDLQYPPKVLKPMPPLVETFQGSIILKPARISPSNHTSYLRIWSVPAHITAYDLWEIASPYTSAVDVTLCRERQEALLAFPENSYDANFAAFFLRKVILDETTTLVFRPMRPDETRPMYKGAEHYP
jgi:hypothetical protein